VINVTDVRAAGGSNANVRFRQLDTSLLSTELQNTIKKLGTATHDHLGQVAIKIDQNRELDDNSVSVERQIIAYCFGSLIRKRQCPNVIWYLGQQICTTYEILDNTLPVRPMLQELLGNDDTQKVRVLIVDRVPGMSLADYIYSDTFEASVFLGLCKFTTHSLASSGWDCNTTTCIWKILLYAFSIE
jgi:hypothetical protein